jgi:hypothetical protein
MYSTRRRTDTIYQVAVERPEGAGGELYLALAIEQARQEMLRGSSCIHDTRPLSHRLGWELEAATERKGAASWGDAHSSDMAARGRNDWLRGLRVASLLRLIAACDTARGLWQLCAMAPGCSHGRICVKHRGGRMKQVKLDSPLSLGSRTSRSARIILLVRLCSLPCVEGLAATCITPIATPHHVSLPTPTRHSRQTFSTSGIHSAHLI